MRVPGDLDGCGCVVLWRRLDQWHVPMFVLHPGVQFGVFSEAFEDAYANKILSGTAGCRVRIGGIGRAGYEVFPCFGIAVVQLDPFAGAQVVSKPRLAASGL